MYLINGDHHIELGMENIRDKKDELISIYEDTLKMISVKYSSYPNLAILCEDVLEVGKKLKE